ncbi:hypothetical protein BC940DRAFT_310639 [Gongronella butleri]|nr:hypothetical protein BC940DRAFT_310639 [Gongronella butleri]
MPPISIQMDQDANAMPESQRVVNEAFNEHLRKANKANNSNYVIPYYWKGSDAPSLEGIDPHEAAKGYQFVGGALTNVVVTTNTTLAYLYCLATDQKFSTMTIWQELIVARNLFGDDFMCDIQFSTWDDSSSTKNGSISKVFGNGMALIFIDYHFERTNTLGGKDYVLFDEYHHKNHIMSQYSDLSATGLKRIGITIKGDDKKKWALTRRTLIVRRMYPEVQKLIKLCFVPGGTLHVGMQQFLVPYLTLTKSKEDFKYMCDEGIFDPTILTYDDITGMAIAHTVFLDRHVAGVLQSLLFLFVLATKKKFASFNNRGYLEVAGNLFGDDFMRGLQVSAWYKSTVWENTEELDKLFGCAIALMFIDYHFERSETFDGKDYVLFDKDHYHDFSMHQHSKLSATRLESIAIAIKGDDKKKWALTRGTLTVRRLHPEVQKLIKLYFVPGGTLHVGMQQLLIPYLALISSKKDFKYMCDQRIFDPSILSYGDIADMVIAPRITLNDHVAETLKSLSNAIEQHERFVVESREHMLLKISVCIGIFTLLNLGSSFWSAFATQSQASAAWYGIQHPTHP